MKLPDNLNNLKPLPLGIPVRMDAFIGMGDILKAILNRRDKHTDYLNLDAAAKCPMTHYGWFGFLNDLAKHHKIILLLYSRNSNTYQLFELFKHIQVKQMSYIEGMHRGIGVREIFRELCRKNKYYYVPHNELVRLFIHFNCEYKYNYIPIRGKELSIFKQIRHKPFIVVHPFAADGIRRQLSLDNYARLMKNISKSINCNIAIIGGSYTRYKRSEKTTTKNIIEEFDYSDKNVWNLVNQTTPRLPVRLIQHATAFIGNHSAFACAAWRTGTPAIICTGPKNQNWIRHHARGTPCITINAKVPQSQIEESFKDVIKFLKAQKWKVF